MKLWIQIAASFAASLAGTAAVAGPVAPPPAFAACSVCHKTGPTDKSTVGPNLWKIGGSKAGSVAGYSFSPAMQKSGIVWTRERLVAFIQDPRGVVPGTKMGYAGQKNPALAAAIADYLMGLK